jgi:hypothetical membrane protein
VTGPADPVAPDPSPRNWFLLAALGVVLYTILDVIAQLLPPHYSAITQAESDLAVGPYGYVMTANFVVRGALSLVFVAALARLYRIEGSSWRRSRGGFVALGGLWGVGAFLLAIFPTDVPATPVNLHGAVHGVVALVVFLAGAFGVYWLAQGFGESPTLRAAQPWAVGLGLFAIVACFVELVGGLFIARIANHYGGLLERIFLGSVLLWIFLVSLVAARATPTAQRS